MWLNLYPDTYVAGLLIRRGYMLEAQVDTLKL